MLVSLVPPKMLFILFHVYYGMRGKLGYLVASSISP